MFVRPLAYLWALPSTALGLLFVPTLIAGGGAQLVEGVLELHGPVISFFLRRCTLLEGGASAMTLGHVVIARDFDLLTLTRTHERVHVRQYERWGPLFIPAYLAASAVVWCVGGQAYEDNPFEREAFGR